MIYEAYCLAGAFRRGDLTEILGVSFDLGGKIDLKEWEPTNIPWLVPLMRGLVLIFPCNPDQQDKDKEHVYLDVGDRLFLHQSRTKTPELPFGKFDVAVSQVILEAPLSVRRKTGEVERLSINVQYRSRLDPLEPLARRNYEDFARALVDALAQAGEIDLEDALLERGSDIDPLPTTAPLSELQRDALVRFGHLEA